MDEPIRKAAFPQGEPVSFAGRRALVVGGTGGIGGRLAERIGLLGAHVVVHGRDEGRSRASAERIVARGGSAEWLCAPIAAAVVPDSLLREAGLADILVPAWGPFARKSLAETTAEDWAALAFADLALPGCLVSRAAPAMAARGYGRILLFGGTRTDAVRGFRRNAAYAAAKTGLGVIAKSVAAEYSAYGVAAAVICPGFVDTEYLDDATRSELAAMSPGGRLMEADAFADFAVDTLLRGLPQANGAVICADSGLYGW